jgi:hypothetical protein
MGSVTSVKAVQGEIPKDFDLAQNYPNPFNPSTTISFEIAHPCLASLALFDVLGQQVAILVNERVKA